MAQFHRPYPPEFRQQMVDLVRAGRTPEELAREFEPTSSAIWNWVRRAERSEGNRKEGTIDPDQTELNRLRREVRQLRQERDILAKAAAGTHRACAMGPGPGSHGIEPRSGSMT